MATALTYLSGAVSACLAVMTCLLLLFAQAISNELNGLTSGFGSTSSSGSGNDGSSLAVGTVLLLGISGLCFVGAVRLAGSGSKRLAYAGNIALLIVLLITAIGTRGGGWVLLLVLAPVGALFALLTRPAPAGSGH